MKNTGWVILFLLMFVCQLLTVTMLIDKKIRDDANASMKEATLQMENEAARHHLEAEKWRHQYYEMLVNAGFFDKGFIDESDARDIVRQGVK